MVGFKVPYSSSHSFQATLTHLHTNVTVFAEVTKGHSSFCLVEPGLWELKASNDCLKFPEEILFDHT
jgi:hypothetical protein